MLCSVFCLAPRVPHLPLETRGLAWYVHLIAMTEAQESEWELQGFLRLRLGIDTLLLLIHSIAPSNSRGHIQELEMTSREQ